MPLRPACPGTEIARAPPLTTRARSSRSRVPRGKRSSRPTSSGAQGSRRSGGGLAPARRRAVALPASRVLSLGSALRGAALALLLCRERHDSLKLQTPRVSRVARFAQVGGNCRNRLNSTFAFSPFQVPFGGKVCNYIQPFYVSFYMGKKRRSSYTRSQGKREDRGRTGFFPLRMP